MITFHQIIKIKMSKIEILELINVSVTFQLSFICIALQSANFSHKSSLSCWWKAEVNSSLTTAKWIPWSVSSCEIAVSMELPFHPAWQGQELAPGPGCSCRQEAPCSASETTQHCLQCAWLGIPFEWGQSKCLKVEFPTLSHFCPCTTLASATSLCIFSFSY